MLNGQVAIITGAGKSAGIGQAIALKLVAQGATAVLIDIEKSAALMSTIKTINANGGKAIAMECDIADTNQINQCVEVILRQYQRIDILINNAGISGSVPYFLDISDDVWDASYHVNVRGAAAFCRAVIPSMLTQNKGVIVNNASLCGLGAIDAVPANYTASKFAMVGLTKSIALEYAEQNIRCNVVCPGVVNTELRKHAMERIAAKENISTTEAQELEDLSIAMRRAAEPEEVADLVLFLSGPDSSYITGAALPIAGGMAPGL